MHKRRSVSKSPSGSLCCFQLKCFSALWLSLSLLSVWFCLFPPSSSVWWAALTSGVTPRVLDQSLLHLCNPQQGFGYKCERVHVSQRLALLKEENNGIWRYWRCELGVDHSLALLRLHLSLWMLESNYLSLAFAFPLLFFFQHLHGAERRNGAASLNLCFYKSNQILLWDAWYTFFYFRCGCGYLRFSIGWYRSNTN